jgi:PAS domain S-box-containing protein
MLLHMAPPPTHTAGALALAPVLRALTADTCDLIVDSVPHIAWTASPTGAVTHLNRRASTYLGCGGGEPQRNMVSSIHPDDFGALARAWMKAIASEEEFALQYRIRRFDGAYRWHSSRATPMRDLDGVTYAWIGMSTDIEDQKKMELALRLSEREATDAATLLRSIEGATPVGLKLVDSEFRILRINSMLADVNGLSVEESLGKTIAEVGPELWPRVADFYRRALKGEAIRNVDVTSPDRIDSNRTRHFLANYFPVWADGKIVGVGNVVVDITERKEADEFRAVVMENVAEGIYTLDCAGLVTFVNRAACDMLGWTEDELIGKPMHETVHFQRADGTAFPAEECSLLHVRTQGRAVKMVDDAFTRRDGSIFPVAYSSAPLRSRSAVHGVVVVFRDATEEKKERDAAQRELATLSWVGRIRDALDEDRMLLYSQPIMPLGPGKASAELLLRMVSRDGEIIPPATFLPVAERFGLIAEIDRWVIAKACKLAADGSRTIELNLSAASIGTADLLPFIERQLHLTGADPTKLVFEITETALMRDMTAGEDFARGLAELGCGIALDDFGTGFGSFTYLKRLPISYLKIDLDFVRELASNRSNLHVVRAIVSLARGFDLKTIAEGIEDQQTLDLLKAEGVDYGQGFYLGHPAPVFFEGQAPA